MSKHRMQPECVENEQAYAGRNSRPRLARPNSQTRTETGQVFTFPCSADYEQDWQPYPLIYNVLHVMTIHNIHAYIYVLHIHIES